MKKEKWLFKNKERIYLIERVVILQKRHSGNTLNHNRIPIMYSFGITRWLL